MTEVVYIVDCERTKNKKKKKTAVERMINSRLGINIVGWWAGVSGLSDVKITEVLINYCYNSGGGAQSVRIGIVVCVCI